MLTKKRTNLFVLSMLLLFLTISPIVLTSAQGTNLFPQSNPGYRPPAEGTPRASVDDFFVSISKNRIIRLIIGDLSKEEAGPAELFFIKVLVFLLLVALVGYAIKRIPGIGDKNSLVALLSIVVSLIAVRYITSEALVNFIWLPYGVLGVFLVTIFPFVIGFFFIERFPSRMFRKVAWSAYLVLFGMLAYFRWPQLDLRNEPTWASLDSFLPEFLQNLGWAYVLIAILSFIMIVFDNRIRYYMHRARYKDIKDSDKRMAAIDIENEIEDLYDKMGRTSNADTIAFLKERIERKEKLRNKILKGP